MPGATQETKQRCRSASLASRLRRGLPLLRRREEGAALVEFAIVLPVLSVLVFGIVDLGRALNYWIDETHLANEAARFAVVNKNPGAAAGDSLQEYIRKQADTQQLRNATTVRICFPNGTQNVGDPVQVTVSSTYTFLRVLSLGSHPITSTAVMRLEAKPTTYTADVSPPCPGAP